MMLDNKVEAMEAGEISMDILTAFASALFDDNTYYLNKDGSVDRTYWATDGAVNHLGLIFDICDGQYEMDEIEEFVNDEHNQSQAMDLATQMMLQTYYKFLKAEGRGLIT